MPLLAFRHYRYRNNRGGSRRGDGSELVLETIRRIAGQTTGLQLATLFGGAIATIGMVTLVVIAIAGSRLDEPYRWLLIGVGVLTALLLITTLKLNRDLQMVKTELSGIKAGVYRVEEQIQGNAQVISERIGQLRQVLNDSGMS